MIEELEPGRYFISKGTQLPYICPACNKVTPFVFGDEVTCVMCGHVGDKEDFEVEWTISRQ